MRLYSTLLAALLLAACGGADSTAPKTVTALSLSISASLVAPAHTLVSNGVPYYACTYRFELTTSGGTTSDLAGWADSEVDYRLSATGATSASVLDTATLQDWFGSSLLFTGAHQTTTRDLGWSGPFTATVVFRYVSTIAGQVALGQTVNVPVVCQ